VDIYVNSIINGYLNTICGNTIERNTIINGSYQSILGDCNGFQTIGNGCSNTISAYCGSYNSISNGYLNVIDSISCATLNFRHNKISSGYNNTISGCYALGNHISNGLKNCIISVNEKNCYNFIGGGNNNLICFGLSSFIGGGQSNSNSAYFSVIGGGIANQIDNGSENSTIGGGSTNIILGGSQRSTISGGYFNTISSYESNIGGGRNNTISSYLSNIGGGKSNTISGYYNTIVGGFQNTIGLDPYNVVGGRENTTNTIYNTIFGFQSYGYLYGQNVQANGGIGGVSGTSQFTQVVARREATLNANGTATMTLDGSGTTRFLELRGNNRAWNVQVNWVIVLTILGSGTGGGLAVGAVKSGSDSFFFKKVGGVGSVSAQSNLASHNDSGMASANITYSVGAIPDLRLTMVAPSTAGTGTTFRAVASVKLVEVAW